MPELTADFVAFARRKLADHAAQVVRCAGLLSDAEAWQRVNEHSNSVANLLLHLRGNVLMWIVDGLGGQPFDRDRPAEFAARGPAPLAPLVEQLQDALRRADEVLAGIDADALVSKYAIQGYDVTGLEAVFHVVEHFAFHTGQIISMTKALRNCDLSLYDAQGRRLDARRTAVP